MSLKITLIGAGSVVFAKSLIGDILQFPELSDATICLMDIDPERLRVAKLMVQKTIAALKVKARVEATLDRREAVRGARYVICTVQVGGYKPGTLLDFEIPRKYGLLQTIGDTLGVGGVFRALRTIPVINAIARDIAEVGAPDCILLNYTNPMAMNCMAVDRAVGIPHVGLCHSVQGTSIQLASLARLPHEDITYLVAGINHMAFFLKFEYKGQDAYPLLFSLLEKPNFATEKVRFEMMRRTGYFVTESSEHQSEYTPYFIHHGQETIDRFGIPIDEYLRRCEAIISTWSKTEAQLLGGKGGISVSTQTHEYGAFIIHSRETNTPRVIYGNVPNRNLIENLPARACVELPCLEADSQGVQPTRIGLLPPQLAALCQTNINVQDLTVEAALTGKREHIYHAVMLDPHTSAALPLDKIWAMCDELIAAHQKHGLLGEFEATLPNTGRTWRGTGDRIMAEARLDELSKPGGETKAKSKSKKQTVQAKILLSNPRPKPAVVKLHVHASSSKEELKDLPSPEVAVKVTVPARGKLAHPVSVPFAGPTEDGVTLHVASDSRDVFTRGDSILPRTILKGSGKGAPFALKLAGFPAVEGTISAASGRLSLRVAVDDTKIVVGDPPWRGSTVELFIAPLDGIGIRQFFLVPQPGLKKVAFLQAGFRPVPAGGGKASIRPHRRGAGYEVDVELSFETAGLPPKTTGTEGFLLDLYARITALGDAHSGGITGLSGHFLSHADSSRFPRVVF